MNAADVCKGCASLLSVGCGGSRRGWGKQTHEVRERFNVREDCRVRTGVGCARRTEVGGVIRRGDEETVRRFVALLGKKLIADSHIDVVGLTREHKERFVLCFPSESGYGSIVCAVVRRSANVCVGMAMNAHRR